ncbi:MAG: glycosyltransferase family 4 protein [Caldilineaceae bacterium]|nr:glycosyltransferase family 4 protein [Caldilineaceae bacterium]
MKVLLISNGYPPEQWAGTETYTAGIARALHARGNQVQVLCGGGWQEGAHYWNGYSDHLEQGIPCRRLHVNWMKAPDPFLYLYDNPVVADFLSGYLGEVRPDIVHVTSCERLSASVVHAVKDAGLPLALSLTDFWFLCPRINLLRSDGENCDGQTTAWDCLRCQMLHTKAYRWSRHLLPDEQVAGLLMEISRHSQLTRRRGLRGMAGDMAGRKQELRRAFARADIRITASQFVRDVFTANGFTEPIMLRPYGHDLSWLRGYTAKQPSDMLRIGYIGQIIPSKGVHLLLEAAKHLPALREGRCRLLVYGDLESQPAYGAQLRRMAAELPNVEFCGTYPHKESGRIFANLDMLVVPSQWYDFPLIIHEAFAAQTPVIATRLGDMAEAVTHEANGLLFEHGSAADLARQLRRICDEPGLLNRLRAGLPAVKTIDTEVDELVDTYRRLIAPAQQTAPAEFCNHPAGDDALRRPPGA